MKQSATEELNGILTNAYKNVSNQWKKCWHMWFTLEEAYFKGDKIIIEEIPKTFLSHFIAFKIVNKTC